MFSFLNIRVGFYLAVRQLRRASLWTTGLIVFVMLLTFLNLVVVTGILVGLIEGINESYRTQYTGDVVLSALTTKNYIEDTPSVVAFIKTLPQVAMLNERYQTGGTIEANYLTRTSDTEKPNATGAQVFGIDPSIEDAFSGLSQHLIEGSYLSDGDYDQILVGNFLLAKYAFGNQPGLTPLTDVNPGTKVRLTINGSVREVFVKGVIKSKIAPLATGIFISSGELRTLMNRTDQNVAQIAIHLTPGSDPDAFKNLLLASGIGEKAQVQTFTDAIPNGVDDIKTTFAMLGNGFSSIGLVVAAITIFIVIFINAITRRKFIGILKGIGISGQAIEISYVFQSLFYAVIGSTIGLVVLYGILVPAIAAHPIDFPFSDGILVASPSGTMIRIGLLILTTVIAGYLPSRMIVRRNTLDSILGRG
ncbi:MAG: ABC-type transport system permease component LolE [Parcubacteria group bacterium Gr01-1014_49]|nr:MAG: ABC-type transport system permease component LolE [Parcubacteria group bacterium Gr01-1014_49]